MSREVGRDEREQWGYFRPCLGKITVKCDACSWTFKTHHPEEWYQVECPACDAWPIISLGDLKVLKAVRIEALKQRIYKLLMPWRKRAIFTVDSAPLRNGEPVTCTRRRAAPVPVAERKEEE